MKLQRETRKYNDICTKIKPKFLCPAIQTYNYNYNLYKYSNYYNS